jgi:hypothetical protein
MDANHTMLLRFSTLGGPGRLLAAAKHNLREISGPNIDDELSVQNLTLAGPTSAKEVVVLAAQLMAAAGIDPKTQRKNGTRAAEVVFGLPQSTPVDIGAYFRACVGWVSASFGDQVLLSAAIHYDESAPHCHVLMLPMKAGKWLASGVFGLRADVKGLQDDFFRNVASRFGLRRAPARLAAADRKALAATVLQHLKATADPVTKSPTWPVVRDAVGADPRPWAEQLGIPITVRLKTLAELKVSHGRGPRREKTSIDVLGAGSPIISPVVGDLRNEAPPASAAGPDVVRCTQQVRSQVRSKSRYAARFAAKAGLSAPSSPTVPALDRAAASMPESTASPASTGKSVTKADYQGAVNSERPGSPGARHWDAAGRSSVHPACPAPTPVVGPPGRFAGRLGLNTLRERRSAWGTPGEPGIDGALDAKGTTRHREQDVMAGAWDPDLG